MAASEIIRICLERKVLVPFLSTRQKEVHNIMRTLFSQEAVWEIERHNIRQEGRREGRQEVQEGFEKIVRNMRKTGLDDAKIASLTGQALSDVEAVK